jgi:hypothetical protein
VNDSGLAPLLKTGYDNINQRLFCALSERWYEDTSSFHLPVAEMTVTLDDVACLLGIPITGRLIEEEELSHERGIELPHDELCFTETKAMKELEKQFGAHVSYTKLKTRYYSLWNMCNQLVEPASEAEKEEQSVVRTVCVKEFLLLLLSYTIFAGKNSITVNLLWLLALQDLDRVGDWSWGRMRLAFLYEQLSLTSDSAVSVVGGYMTLLVIIYFIIKFGWE